MGTGIYVFGAFIEQSTEYDNNGKRSDYILLATGGRKGAVSIKFDSSDGDFREILDGAALGDTLLCRVKVSAFRDNVYYTLQGMTRGKNFLEALEAVS